MQLPARAGLQLGLLGIVVITLWSAFLTPYLPPVEFEALAFYNDRPIAAVALQFAFLLIFAWMVEQIGRAAGGRGTFAGSAAMVGWLTLAATAPQIAQSILLLANPALGAAGSVLTFVWFLWALGAFIAELHGFRDALKVLGGVFISLFGALLIVAALIALTGAPVPGAR